MTSIEKIREIVSYAIEHGDDKAVEKFVINYETLGRYKREIYRIKHQPKILVFDIENAPTEAYVWNMRMYNTSISAGQLKNDWFMISWAAKWLNSSEILSDILTPTEARKRNDKRIVKSLWTLFDQADIIVAHNGEKFDVPMTNTRFLFHGLKPPSPYRILDTLKMAKKTFSVTFNSLNYLGKYLNLGQKKDTDFQLWIDCMSGLQEALNKMLLYNRQDVNLLEDIYHTLKGWSYSHPNINTYQQTTDCCSHCGSANIFKKGSYVTQTHEYDSYQCKDCGGYSRKTAKTLIATAR